MQRPFYWPSNPPVRRRHSRFASSTDCVGPYVGLWFRTARQDIHEDAWRVGC